MINNDYICQLNLDINIEYLKNMVLTVPAKLIPGGASHHREVILDPYLISLKEKYPFLSPIYNVYNYPGYSKLPPHIDSSRNCALNIPILNTENSDTIFYKLVEPVTHKYVAEKRRNEITSLLEESFKFSLTTPTLVNNSIPHSMTNNSSDRRIIISWSIDETIDFITAKTLFSY